MPTPVSKVNHLNSLSSTKTRPQARRLRLRPRERRPFLLVGDLVVAYLALMLALIAWASSSGEWLGFSSEFLSSRVQGWFYLLPVVWLLLNVELYDVNRASKVRDTIRIIATASAIELGLYAIIYLAVPAPGSLPRLGIGLFLVIVSVLSLLWRLLYIRIFTAPAFTRRVLVVGAGRAGTALLEVLQSMDPAPFAVVGVIDDDPKKYGTELQGYPVLGGSECLSETIKRGHLGHHCRHFWRNAGQHL